MINCILYDGTNKKLTGKLQVLQNPCLRTRVLPKQHIPTTRLYKVGIIANLEMRGKLHLQLYMYKQKHYISMVNTRNVATHIHDAVLYTTIKPNSAKYKSNAIYKVAIAWNSLSVAIRKSQTYTILKDVLNEKLISQNTPTRNR